MRCIPTLHADLTGFPADIAAIQIFLLTDLFLSLSLTLTLTIHVGIKSVGVESIGIPWHRNRNCLSAVHHFSPIHGYDVPPILHRSSVVAKPWFNDPQVEPQWNHMHHGTCSAHQINFTKCNRSLVAVISSSLGRYDSVLINRLRIGHTRLTNSYLLKGWESTGMWSLPFSAHHQAHFDRLHPLQCSTSEIFWSGHTQGRLLKCCISQHHRLC